MTTVCEYARKSQSSPRSRPRPILDSNQKVSNNEIRNEKNKQTNNNCGGNRKQTKKNKTKQNKTGGVREFLGGSEKDPAVAAEKRRGCPFSNKYE